MDFEKAIRPLGRFTPMLEKVPQAVRDAVFDIRISVDKPVLLCCGDRILFLREDGDTAQYFSQNNVTATREDVEEIFLRLCGYSVYSHMEEIRGGFVSADNLFNYQAKVIKELAEKESCVFIGRCADFVLKDRSDVMSVFIHAPQDYCLARGMERNSMTEKEMERFIAKTDKYRGDFYHYYTGRTWNDARNYDLCLDSSKLGFDKCVEAIKAYAKVRFGEDIFE